MFFVRRRPLLQVRYVGQLFIESYHFDNGPGYRGSEISGMQRDIVNLVISANSAKQVSAKIHAGCA